MNELVFQKFLKSINKISSSGYKIPNKIALALSGGVDSIALLNLLTRYKNDIKNNLEIHALTIDHGLRAESSTEAKYLNDLVINQMKYPITHKILKIKSTINENQIERHARELRYEMMYDYCKKNHIETIFMGHHLDDQLETFILRLFSNSTIFGLLGMRPVAPGNLNGLNKIDLIRPLLDISKDEIYRYANDKSLHWFEDHTNKDTSLTPRNKIRHFLSQHENLQLRKDLIKLHSRLDSIVNDAIYSRMKNIANDLDLSMTTKLNKSLMSLEIEIKIDKFYYDNSKLNIIDYLVLDRLLFTEIWLISPSRNYLYGFTKFDNKYSVLTPHSNNSQSISEKISANLRSRRKNCTTLLGCLIEWKTVDSDVNNYTVKIKVFRERSHRFKKQSGSPDRYISFNNENLNEVVIFYDNRIFITLQPLFLLPQDISVFVKNFDLKKYPQHAQYLTDLTDSKNILNLLDRAQIPILLADTADMIPTVVLPTLLWNDTVSLGDVSLFHQQLASKRPIFI